VGPGLEPAPLLLPPERALELWLGSQQGRAGRLENASRLDGSELVEGLALDLEEIWRYDLSSPTPV
jgi:hypothetical protein